MKSVDCPYLSLLCQPQHRGVSKSGLCSEPSVELIWDISGICQKENFCTIYSGSLKKTLRWRPCISCWWIMGVKTEGVGRRLRVIEVSGQVFLHWRSRTRWEHRHKSRCCQLNTRLRQENAVHWPTHSRLPPRCFASTDRLLLYQEVTFIAKEKKSLISPAGV